LHDELDLSLSSTDSLDGVAPHKPAATKPVDSHKQNNTSKQSTSVIDADDGSDFDLSF
jgi:hypothetical protein